MHCKMLLKVHGIFNGKSVFMGPETLNIQRIFMPLNEIFMPHAIFSWKIYKL